MATSGSRNFALTRNNLIKRAFQVLNLYDLNTTIPAVDNEFAVDLLNAMIKQWQTRDIYLWNREEATLFTQYNTSVYSMGLTGDHITKDTYISTAVNGALSSGVNVIVVDSTTGMTAADNVGITLSDSTRQWTTITTVDSSTQITVADNTTASVADNATVVSYTNKVDRPLLILNARRGLLSSDSETTLVSMRRHDYFNISDKTSGGQSNSYYYDKQLTLGKLHLWPRPDTVDIIIKLTLYENIEDMDSSTDDFDFPQEYTMALLWGLAAELAQAYGMYAELDKLVPKAMALLNDAAHFNYDEESIFISPNMKGGRPR